ncbi:helix-turn-helix domain-containing protein [Paraburkholderia sp. BCC1886]|uniref:helix-turn-helix domain-containing protein n=1 Tax=Paraburkholderia sp. BCC1886 TaxID=2562670 RepID=UPI0016432878|nr:helix-turn-helix transcriptional regulator [Paraburkholderia sp. BCC1886]
MSNEAKAKLQTNVSSVYRVLIKEVRLERGLTQAFLAEQLDRSPSWWSKLESGASEITLDQFVDVARVFNVQPSEFLRCGDGISPLLREHFEFSSDVIAEGADDLLRFADAFFESKGYMSLRNRPGIYLPISASQCPTVVRYCIDEKFREWLDSGAALDESTVHAMSMPGYAGALAGAGVFPAGGYVSPMVPRWR